MEKEGRIFFCREGIYMSLKFGYVRVLAEIEYQWDTLNIIHFWVKIF